MSVMSIHLRQRLTPNIKLHSARDLDPAPDQLPDPWQPAPSLTDLLTTLAAVLDRRQPHNVPFLHTAQAAHEAQDRRHSSPHPEYRFHNDVPNRLTEHRRLSIQSWNPGPRRVKWHMIALQEAIEYLEHEYLTSHFHVTHYGGCAVLFRNPLRRLRRLSMRPKINSNDFGVFGISRFEFDVRRCGFFLNDSNFWCVQSSNTHNVAVHVLVLWLVCAHRIPFRMLWCP